MDARAYRALEELALYDSSLNIMLRAYDQVVRDKDCDQHIAAATEAVMIAIMSRKATHLLPDGEDSRKIIDGAPGIEEVLEATTFPARLATMTVIGYAIALSQTSWGWKPWERVREALLQQDEDD